MTVDEVKKKVIEICDKFNFDPVEALEYLQKQSAEYLGFKASYKDSIEKKVIDYRHGGPVYAISKSIDDINITEVSKMGQTKQEIFTAVESLVCAAAKKGNTTESFGYNFLKNDSSGIIDQLKKSYQNAPGPEPILKDWQEWDKDFTGGTSKPATITKSDVNGAMERFAKEKFPDLTVPQAITKAFREYPEETNKFYQEYESAALDPEPVEKVEPVQKTVTELKVEKMVDDLRKIDPKLTKEAAATKVWKENPDLYAESEAERRGL